jgi:nitroreductase
MGTSSFDSTAWSSQDLLSCLTAAIAAPSIHNTQPWLLRVRDDTIDVYADRSRQLDIIDPLGRALTISVGAALFNLRTAILAHGRVPKMTLRPSPAEPGLLARVVLGAAVTAPRSTLRLAEAIARRHSNRQPFTTSRVPDCVADDLRAAAIAESARLLIADDTLTEGVIGVVRTAENLRQSDPDYLVELAAWTGPDHERRDGVPPAADAPHDPQARIPLRDFGLARPGGYRWPQVNVDAPTVAMLYTDGDDVRTWLRAGQALERVLLTATAAGLQSTLMTQPLEYPQLRALLDDTANGRVAQAIIRLGYGSDVPAPAPRRPLAEVLI